jgi:hypothetical protein
LDVNPDRCSPGNRTLIAWVRGTEIVRDGDAHAGTRMLATIAARTTNRAGHNQIDDRLTLAS